MSVPGGGDITELLRRLGSDALIHELERAGCAPRVLRAKCPWVGCEHKGKDREYSAAVYASGDGHFRVHCHACEKKGDLVDLLQRTRALSSAEAIAHVKGEPVPERPRPELRVVGSTPPEDEGKLRPTEVQRLWDALLLDSQAGRAYLEGRGLGDAIDAKLVRFTSEDLSDKQLASLARRKYRVAALTSDVVGQPRGIQARLVGEPKAKDPKILSVKGSVTGRAFFGEPGRIAEAPFIAVAEGLADTLALSLWVDGAAVVVGAAGKGSLPTLAVELENAGIDVTGKLFALFPQNDRPELKSNGAFLRLHQLLIARGARTVSVPTPDVYADLAEWRRAKPEVEWPPAKVQEAFEAEPGDEQKRLTVQTVGHALPTRAQYKTDKYAQNLTTLAALFDDPSSREALLLRRGELSFCQMTHKILVGGQALADKELTKVRVEIERFARSTDGKSLQFKAGDVRDVLTMLASRREVHPIQEWLKSLAVWDGTQRLETEFPKLLGHDAGSFEGRLLRRWAVSAVARLMEPGCQVDTVLILTGNQAAKKTSFFRTLGGQWTTSSKVEPGDKDGMMIMREYWIIEWGELRSMQTRSREETKDFITNAIDTFREPYGRDLTKAKRHCVLVGTANETDILEDPTGNRRYWPVEVLAEKISMSWLRSNRDQLFAEALAIYRGRASCKACVDDEDQCCSEHRWWLTEEEELLLKERNKTFQVDEHPWVGLIENWLTWPEVNRLDFITTGQVLKAAIGIEKEQDWSTADARTVAIAMKQLGWRSGRDSIGSRQRGWLRPKTEELAP